ncbi:MAG: hypothetical protein GF383_12800, partial [Candidatus Lokiarchaeota archaeon]|nr:hypothetical protein [Candidatus Lokiarchaeota archaeon]MBD3341961.1 hypothetical protein [Candidatus Lokiarchaeota archaeon]
MITTKDYINYQFSLIFGHSSSRENITVGDIVGPGNLTKQKVKELSQSVMKFLRMFNAMLLDFAGSEVFSIEFELLNLDESANINIFPKSMIFIPGFYKEGESLLLALKPETGILNYHKARRDVRDISKLLFEIEEFIERPDLKPNDQYHVFEKFASRFSKKLYGNLIEDKWNKKLIGLNVSLPTEKDFLNNYSSIKSKMEILWYKKPNEIQVSGQSFEKKENRFTGHAATDHLKYIISEPSSNFIIEKTLELGTNLMNLANTGTINEIQEEMVKYLTKNITETLKDLKKEHTAQEVIFKIKDILNEQYRRFKKFFNHAEKFLKRGETGNLEDLATKFKYFLYEKAEVLN